MNSVADSRERQNSISFEHKKLCRVSRGPRIQMGSTPPSLVADLTTKCSISNDGEQQLNNICTNFYATRTRQRLETVDSDPCYSSDGEHSNLSRNASTNSDCLVVTDGNEAFSISGRPNVVDDDNDDENLPSAAADNNAFGVDVDSAEYNKILVTPHDSGYSDTNDSSTTPNGTNEYAALLEYTLKLGYSELQLRTVLQRFSSSSQIGQNNLLAELIKLGQNVQETSPLLLSSTSTSGGGGVCETSQICPSSIDALNHHNHQLQQSNLRAVVIDGSNVAITHGHKEVFSCKGIKECIDWFKKRGHTDIKVFVPQFRKETPRSDLPITDQFIMFELEQEGILVWTPSRRLGGRRIVCHDDRYIVKTAADKDAVIVSNDEYRDIMKENPEYKKVIEERLLMYSFVDGKFMPPDDPLGRYGPKLEQFLRKGCVNTTAPTCPYGRKCTYGNKCKYFHPERSGGGYKSVTDRLRDHADFHRRISPSNSLQSPPRLVNPETAAKAGGGNNKPLACRSQSLNQQALLRQHSPSPGRQSPLQQKQKISPQSSSFYAVDGGDVVHQHLAKRSSNPENLTTSTTTSVECPPPPPLFCVGTDGFLMPPSLQHIWHQQQQNSTTSHQPVGRNLSAPGYNSSSRIDAAGGVFCHNTNSCSSSTSFHNPAALAMAMSNRQHCFGGVGGQAGCYSTHYGYGTAAGYHQHQQQQQQRKNSISDSQLNLVGQHFYCGGASAADICGSGEVFHSLNDSGFATPPLSQADANWYVPSTTVWGPLENSSVPIFSSTTSPASSWQSTTAPPPPRSLVSRVNTTPLSTNNVLSLSSHAAASSTPSLQTIPSTSGSVSPLLNNEKRMKLYYHLSQLFPGDIVAAVLNANPNEFDPQKLCPLIIAIQRSSSCDNSSTSTTHFDRVQQ